MLAVGLICYLMKVSFRMLLGIELMDRRLKKLNYIPKRLMIKMRVN